MRHPTQVPAAPGGVPHLSGSRARGRTLLRLSRGWMMRWSPLLFHPVPPPMPTHGRVESGNPLLLPHTHTAKRGAQQNPGREERPTLIHPPKESGGRTIGGTAPRCRRAKSTDLCAPGQLCWHRRSLGNVRRLKIEQMFLLKGLLQCSA